MPAREVSPLAFAALALIVGVLLGYAVRPQPEKTAPRAESWKLENFNGVPARIETMSGRVEIFNPQTKTWIGLGEPSAQEWAQFLSSPRPATPGAR